MTDLCGQIESASKNLKPGSNPEAAAPLLEVLAEFNKSHIVGSDLLKNATATAQKMQAKGVYGEAAETGIAGGNGWVQQKDGMPNFLEIVEGNRTEGLRLDDKGEPMLNTVTQMCGNKPIRSAFFIHDGKRTLSSVSLEPDLEVLMDHDGKPEKVKSMY